MHEGTTIKIEAITGDVVTTTSGRFKVGHKPTAHRDKGHADLTTGSILVATQNTPPDPSSIQVYIYGGCDCRFLLYPQSN